MDRPIRTLALLFVALGFMGIMCLSLMFLLAGDDLIDFVKIAPARLNVFLHENDLNQPVGIDSTPLRFVVELGDSPDRIANNLVAAGLIDDSGLFKDYVRAESLNIELEAGVYFLNQTQSIREIAHALTDSSISQITFTILPGWRIEQVAEAIDFTPLFGFTGAEFLAQAGRGAEIPSAFAQQMGIPSGQSVEGFLFPDTYSLPPTITALELRDLLLESFAIEVGDDLILSASQRGFSMYEIVTLASIIQREAVQNDEHPLISSVYNNRLQAGMRLDADPTVQYPLGSSENWWVQITVADYQGVISDYNTYLNFGLPPSPIANPSLSAIRAAIFPENSDFLFFRADCRSDGYHDFAVTYEAHLANGC